MKNFQGERASINEKPEINLLVSDYMTKKLIVFKEDQSVIEVMEALAKNSISGGPVVDENDFLIGIVSEADMMKKISESRYFNMPIGKVLVGSLMTKSVETIDYDTNIFDAATIFYKHKRRRLPVMNNSKLVGQISRKDIVIAFLKLTSTDWKK